MIDDLSALERKRATREPLSQYEVARVLGLSRSVVREIEERAIKKLRAVLEENPGGNVPHKEPEQ